MTLAQLVCGWAAYFFVDIGLILRDKSSSTPAKPLASSHAQMWRVFLLPREIVRASAERRFGT